MAYDHKGLMRLHLAIVLRAMEDLKKNPQDEVCRAWLLEDGLFILDVYDIPGSREQWQSLIGRDCQVDFVMVRK
jgi:hypothetical protein